MQTRLDRDRVQVVERLEQADGAARSKRARESKARIVHLAVHFRLRHAHIGIDEHRIVVVVVHVVVVVVAVQRILMMLLLI